MSIPLKISQKGFLLIFLPIVFDLAFIVMLSHLQARTEEVVAEQKSAREIMADTQLTLTAVTQCSVNLTSFVVFRNPGYLRRATAQVEEAHTRLSDLDKSIDQHSYLSAPYGRFRDYFRHTLDLLDSVRESVETGDVERVGPLAKRQLRKGIDHCVESASYLCNVVNEACRNFTREEEKRRKAAQTLLMSGIVMNVMLGLLFCFLFVKDITGRLAVIVDNAARLVGGKELRPRVGGADEIAHLDQVFHNMASALQEAARKEGAMIDKAQDVITSLDAEYRITKVNTAGERLWRCPAAEMSGRVVAELIHPDDRRSLTDALEKLKTAETDSQTLELRYEVDGQDGWTLWSIHWSSFDQAYFCVIHDITDAKNVERLKQDFINMVSHDLRTPLNSTGAFLELLKMGAYGDLTPKGRKTVEMMEGNMRRLVALVSNLLDLEKMDSGKMQLDFQPASLATIITDALNLVRSFAEAKKVTLVFEPESDLELQADTMRLGQVVQNLVANAVKFSAMGDKVMIETELIDGNARVTVRDSGCGIAPEDLATVFDKFKQAKGKEKGGSGLGLAISKAIIEAHYGQLGVESTPGAGTTFWFQVPLSPPVPVKGGITVSILEGEPQLSDGPDKVVSES